MSCFKQARVTDGGPPVARAADDCKISMNVRGPSVDNDNMYVTPACNVRFGSYSDDVRNDPQFCDVPFSPSEGNLRGAGGDEAVGNVTSARESRASEELQMDWQCPEVTLIPSSCLPNSSDLCINCETDGCSLEPEACPDPGCCVGPPSPLVHLGSHLGPAAAVAPTVSAPPESSDFPPISSPGAAEFTPTVATVRHRGATFYVAGEFVANDVRVPVRMLLDTGASVTLVQRQVVDSLGLMHEIYPAARLGVTSLVSAGGDQLGLLGAVDLNFYVGVSEFTAPVFVVDGLREACLLGADILSTEGFSIALDSEPRLCKGDVCTPLSRRQGPVVRRCAVESSSLTFFSLLILCAALCSLGAEVWAGFSLTVLTAQKICLAFRALVVTSFLALFSIRLGGWFPWPSFPWRRWDSTRPISKPPDQGVYLVSSVTVPPLSQLVVLGQLPEAEAGEYLIEPHTQSICLVSRCVSQVRADCSVPLTITNLSDSAVTVESNVLLGSACLLGEAAETVVCTAAVDHPDGPLTATQIRDMFDWTKCAATPQQQARLVSVLEQFSDVLARDAGDVGNTPVLEHTIDTGTARPVRQRARRLPPERAHIVGEQLQSMMENDIVEESSSPWASPIVLVKKSDNTFRFCVDYRQLNAVTHQDAYPLPRIDETLDNLGGAVYFSTLDLQSGYWQVPVAEADREKTAFITPQGLYQFKRMPFGLTNAPATFQRLMHCVLRGLSPLLCLVYLDDIIIFSKSFEEHLQHTIAVLTALREAGLKIKPKKCHLLCIEVKFLGHVVSADGVATDPEKLQAVRDWPVPCSQKSLQSFLGFASYYRRFVSGFSQIAGPLFELLKKSKSFAWEEPHDSAFNHLKKALSEAPVLAFPDFSKPFVVDTDASTSGVGAVLSQLDSEGRERPVAFISRALSTPERNYSVTRLELLAVVWALRYFKPYLLSQRFVLRSDHGSLRWLLNFKDPSGQMARWLDTLAEFDFSIVHRPGARHQNADGLSRQFVNAVLLENRDWDHFRETFALDPDLCTVRERHKAGESSRQGDSRAVLALLRDSACLKVEEDLLYYSCNGKTMLVVPRSLREGMLLEAHGGATSGHFGVDRTLQRLRATYYWPGMTTDVNVYCRACTVCAQAKDPPRKQKAPLGTVRAGFPFEITAVDIMGPFPRSTKGNLYILVLADYFSKWVEIMPLPDMLATTVANVLLDNVFSRFGMPAQLHSDQGPQFESKLMAELCKLLGIKKTRTTPYHPQGDGMVERANRTIQIALKSYVDRNYAEWDRYLPQVQLAYNTSVHRVTGYTPHFVLFGREAGLPLHALCPPPDKMQYDTPSAFVRDLRARLVDCFDIIRLKLDQSHRVAKTAHRGVESRLRVGDFVWLHSVPPVGVSPKLFKAWTGPWQISEIQGSRVTIVRVGPLPSMRHARTLSVHVDRLRLMVGRPAEPVQPIPANVPVPEEPAQAPAPEEPVQAPATEPVLPPIPLDPVLPDPHDPQGLVPVRIQPPRGCRLPRGTYADMVTRYDQL